MSNTEPSTNVTQDELDETRTLIHKHFTAYWDSITKLPYFNANPVCAITNGFNAFFTKHESEIMCSKETIKRIFKLIIVGHIRKTINESKKCNDRVLVRQFEDILDKVERFFI